MTRDASFPKMIPYLVARILRDLGTQGRFFPRASQLVLRNRFRRACDVPGTSSVSRCAHSDHADVLYLIICRGMAVETKLT